MRAERLICVILVEDERKSWQDSEDGCQGELAKGRLALFSQPIHENEHSRTTNTLRISIAGSIIISQTMNPPRIIPLERVPVVDSLMFPLAPRSLKEVAGR